MIHLLQLNSSSTNKPNNDSQYISEQFTTVTSNLNISFNSSQSSSNLILQPLPNNEVNPYLPIQSQIQENAGQLKIPLQF